MKKIYLIAMLCAAGTAHGATTSLGHTIEDFFAAPKYLVAAADAWDSVIGAPLRGGTIATRMSALNSQHDNSRLYDVMSVLAFNHTAMTIYQTNRHLDAAYDMATAPLTARRGDMVRNFVINAHGGGATDKFEHHKNDDFEMRTWNAGASAYAYVTDGLTFGVGYTHAKSESHDMPLDADGASNIVTLFSKYLGDGGWYMNTALAAGQTRWDLDKTVAGVADKTSVNTNIYSGQVKTGLALQRGRLTLRPEIGARYTRLINDKHIDAAAQNFKKWWYNTLNVDAGASVGITFAAGGVLVQPTINIGAGYDIIHNGTDHVATRLVTGQSYDMPVHAPGRGEIRGGGGVTLYGSQFSINAEYTMHSRSDYVAHDIRGGIKIAF